jgi:RNA-directed DNA polymerase
MCWSQGQAERALARLVELLAELGLRPKAAKTRIVHLQHGGEGLDFSSGFTIGWRDPNSGRDDSRCCFWLAGLRTRRCGTLAIGFGN